MNQKAYTHKRKAGERIGEWTLIHSLPYKHKEPCNKRLQWRCQCSCGKIEDVPEYYMIRPHGPKLDCGHSRKTIYTENPEHYSIWYMMHVRCYDPRHTAYKHYGGRGIHVCPEWHKDNPDGFKNFLEYMGPRPSKQHTIDRVDNNGSYYPYQADGVTRQVRWATKKEQRNNQRTPEELARDAAIYRQRKHT